MLPSTIAPVKRENAPRDKEATARRTGQEGRDYFSSPTVARVKVST
jgi:hypothetical protein